MKLISGEEFKNLNANKVYRLYKDNKLGEIKYYKELLRKYNWQEWFDNKDNIKKYDTFFHWLENKNKTGLYNLYLEFLQLKEK